MPKACYKIVELINGNGIVAEVGATAIVKSVSNGYVSIIWKRDLKWHNQGDGGYLPSDFKYVSVKGQQLVFGFMSKST